MATNTMKKIATIIFIVLLVSGCVRVKVYQRETHAKKSMQDKPQVVSKLEGHVHEYREGSIGGSGVGGGGCGCN